MKKIKIKRSRRRGVGNGGFVVVICTSQNPFDNRSLSLVSHDPSNDQGPRPSTCRLTYQFHNVHHSTYEYMSTSYHHELSVQDAQSYVHPPLQPFLEVATYQARRSRVFAGYSTASGLTFRPLLIYHHCYVWSIYRFRCLGCRKHSMAKGVASYTSSQVHHSSFHKATLAHVVDNYIMEVTQLHTISTCSPSICCYDFH